MHGAVEVLMDIKVVNKDPNTGVLTIGMSDPPQYVSGIDLLVQIVTIELLTTPGRSITNPSSGGNLKSLVGSNVAFDDIGEIFAEVRMMVTAAEKNIMDQQVNSRRPANEKLARLDLVDLVPDEESMQLEVILNIVSLDQQSTQAAVGVK